VSTDITARGMHIDDLVWVMNFDLPFEAVYYIHRCGRVGRMNAEGFAYNLVTPKDANIIVRINEAIKNQSAMRLTTFDEAKFAAVKSKNLPKVVTKIDKKKAQLTELKEKITYKKKKAVLKKHVKTIKGTSTPRYKRKEERPVGSKKFGAKKVGARNSTTSKKAGSRR